jgi:hypothetical protein
MSKLSSSSERHSDIIAHLSKDRDESEVDAAVNDLTLDNLIRSFRSKEQDPAWAENNLEYDLRTTDWILEKTRSSEAYAQNLYAAMCNNQFKKIPPDTVEGMIEVLADSTKLWSRSWRSSGGIIADMREQGGYMDWYCSGIRGDYSTEIEEQIANNELTEEQIAYLEISKHFVAESIVTDEIRDDLRKLGWSVVPYDDEEN